MDPKKKQSTIDLTVSKGLEYLVVGSYRELLNVYNTSIASDPRTCFQLAFLCLALTEGFSSYLQSREQYDILAALNRMRQDVPTSGVDQAGLTFATTLADVPDERLGLPGWIVTAAAVALFYKGEGSGDPVGEALATTYLDRVFEKDYVDVLMAFGDEMRLIIFLFFAMWKCNYPGIAEQLNKQLPLQDQLTDAEKAALGRIVRKNSKDMAMWLQIALNFYKDQGFTAQDYNPIAFVLILLLTYRVDAASMLTQRHPDFAPAEQMIAGTNQHLRTSQSFADEYYELLNLDFKTLSELSKADPSLREDVYLSVFTFAHASFLYQGDDELWRRQAEKIMQADEEVVGIPFLALLIVLFWCSDYQDFRSMLEEAVTQAG